MRPRPVFPELITGREDQFISTAWRIREGQALRGHASCDFAMRILEVPYGSAELDRVIRAHELMHLRVSPHDVHPLVVHSDIRQRALECAEECRVNELLTRTGFDVSTLTDGSERSSGSRLAERGSWEEAVFFFVATIGTGAEREFLKGVRRGAPEWVKPLGVLRRRIKSILDSTSTTDMSSTYREVGESLSLPRGFETTSVLLARLMMSAAEAEVPVGADALRQFRRSLEPGGRRAATGRFAELIFDPSVRHDAVGVNRPTRRARPNVTGRSLRYPGRLLTDPHRRAFAAARAVTGGVVIVDQSGSMDVDADDLDHLLGEVPGAVVVGYSHRPGDRTGVANAWVLAVDGRRSPIIPVGNVGNGVDGPVLEWAIQRRRSFERIVWVTDGQVTDSNDHPSRPLARECARLVARHRILLVRTLDDAARILRRGPAGGLENPLEFGRLGRELKEMAGVTGPR